MGCTYLQGYLFSHPLSGPALAAMLIHTRPEAVMVGGPPPPPPPALAALPAPRFSPPSFVG